MCVSVCPEDNRTALHSLDFIIQVIQISEGGNKVGELKTSDECIVFSVVRPFCLIITINVHAACVFISSFSFFSLSIYGFKPNL